MQNNKYVHKNLYTLLKKKCINVQIYLFIFQLLKGCWDLKDFCVNLNGFFYFKLVEMHIYCYLVSHIISVYYYYYSYI